MKRNPATLTDTEYDLIVVGGGIFGVCSAWDAAARGLKVALIEQGDFGHATSANHFKVVHGGIRYLQHLDILRIRESSAERSAMLRIAPHLVQPMPFAIPTYGHGMESREIMMAALAMYDACTFDRNRDISDPTRHVPRSRTISRAETLNMFPQLRDTDLTGAAIFHDGQMQNPPRLSLAFVQSAVDAGADVANYTEVVSFLRDGEDEKATVTGVAVHDKLTGDEYEVRGKLVLNATGPWAKWLLGTKKETTLPQEPKFSRDAYFVVNRKLVDSHALAIQGQTKDPDAVLSRGNRHLFLVPWRDYTLVGVWHIVFNGRPEEFTLTDEDLQEFIDEVNISCPELAIERDEVSMWNAGLTLFGENDPNAKDLSYGKRSILVDHKQQHGIDGLISLIGVRFTTARGMAEKAINMAFQKLGKDVPICKTRVKPLHGGEFDTFAGLLSEATNRCPDSVDHAMLEPMIHNHGTHYAKLFNLIEQNADLGSTIANTTTTKADVVHAVREEMAKTLGDIVFRRTDMGTGSHPGFEALQTSVDLMATELGWSDDRKYRELEDVEALFPNLGAPKAAAS